jgi:hypothetical protein
MLYENDRRIRNGIRSSRGVEAAPVKFRGVLAIVFPDAEQRVRWSRERRRERDLIEPAGRDRVRLDDGSRSGKPTIAGGDEVFEIVAESGTAEIDEHAAVSGDRAERRPPIGHKRYQTHGAALARIEPA